MKLFPKWLAFWNVATSIIVTILLLAFCVQTVIYRYKNKDSLSQTFSILAAIGLFKIIASCVSSYIYTIYVVNLSNNNENQYNNFYNWLSVARVIAVFLQMLFFVWRLELTFVNTNFQISNITLICYHIAMLINIIGAVIFYILYFHDDNSQLVYVLLYYPTELIRLGIFFAVSYQFVNKLLELIAVQHSTSKHYNTREPSAIPAIAKTKHSNSDSSSGSISNFADKVNKELVLAIEFDLLDDSFTIRNYKLINVVAKLSFLACLDFITLFFYVTVTEINRLLWDHGQIQLAYAFDTMRHVSEPLSWVIFVLTVWLSFTYTEKQYQCLFGCFHRWIMACFEKRAKKRAHTRTLAALSPSLSPVTHNQTKGSVSDVEMLSFEYHVMSA